MNIFIFLTIIFMGSFKGLAMVPRDRPTRIALDPNGRALDAQNWAQKDFVDDKIVGTSTERLRNDAKIFLRAPAEPLVVAVIDTGVDISHPSLKNVIWTNPGEAGALANNGIDDDHNGYVDDVHGWNFLGSSRGQVTVLAYEVARERARLSALRQARPWTRKEKKYFERISKMEFANAGMAKDQSAAIDESPGGGNNNVAAGDAFHGTHCAGIIAGEKDPDGERIGQATGVRIMPIRAVPSEGDERDIEIAKAIQYATDNGAKIISMSFGKYLSPQKSRVDTAIQNAEKQGILIVKAAGNENRDGDRFTHFPSATALSGHRFSNLITVGASTPNADAELRARFSNYGKKAVDLFAPGTSIYSTLPGQAYGFLSGTSMAAPEAAGVAALLWTQSPELSIAEIKTTLFSSVTRFNDLIVGTKKTSVFMQFFTGPRDLLFSDLSASGGVVNAYSGYLNLLRAGKIKP